MNRKAMTHVPVWMVITLILAVGLLYFIYSVVIPEIEKYKNQRTKIILPPPIVPKCPSTLQPPACPENQYPQPKYDSKGCLVSYECRPTTIPSTPTGTLQAKIVSLAKDLGLDAEGQKLALRVAAVEGGDGVSSKTASNIAHCKDGTNNCGSAEISKIKTDGLGSYGVFQLNTIHSNWFTSAGATAYAGCSNGEMAYDFECNLRIGTKFLAEMYEQRKGTCAIWECDNKQYCGWDRVLREYNGWASGSACSQLSQGQLQYVALVNAVDVTPYA